MAWYWIVLLVFVGGIVVLFALLKYIFQAPNVPVMNGGEAVAAGGSTVTLEADDAAGGDPAEMLHKCRFEIRYSDGTKDKPKKGKWKQKVALKNIPGPARIYAYNVCPFTSYASGKSKALEVIVI